MKKILFTSCALFLSHLFGKNYYRVLSKSSNFSCSGIQRIDSLEQVFGTKKVPYLPNDLTYNTTCQASSGDSTKGIKGAMSVPGLPFCKIQ